jgi:hypothetical protein
MVQRAEGSRRLWYYLIDSCLASVKAWLRRESKVGLKSGFTSGVEVEVQGWIHHLYGNRKQSVTSFPS